MVQDVSDMFPTQEEGDRVDRSASTSHMRTEEGEKELTRSLNRWKGGQQRLRNQLFLPPSSYLSLAFKGAMVEALTE